MKKNLVCLSLIFLLFACKDKKKSLQDDATVTVSDFIEFFPEVSLPYYVSDSNLVKRPNDSMVIGQKNFAKFVPDSLYRKEFGKGAHPRLYAMGRAVEKNKEKYLFIKAVSGAKRVAYLACFSKDDKFLRSMPLVRTGAASSAYGLLDSKFQITTYRENKKGDGEVIFKRNVYFYDRNSNQFTLIMTEPNEDIIQDVINPIDTFATKHKLSGDYAINKRNYITFRDGKNNSELQVFVHRETAPGECNGEIKGVVRLVSANKAVFAPDGNPCRIEFTFAGSKVTMAEKGGCGSFRDIKCFFEGTYWKKKKAVKGKKK